MDNLQTIIMLIYFMLLINLFIRNYFEKLTKYNDIELHYMESKFILVYMFFGFIMLVFYKKIREYRKTYYMRNYIRHMELLNLTGLNMSMSDDKYDRKYKYFKRYLKLKKVRNKSKSIF